MSKNFRIDGVEYNTEDLSEHGRELMTVITFVQRQMHLLNNQKAVLTKAKNAYISDLKSEILEGRTGIDLASLISEE